MGLRSGIRDHGKTSPSLVGIRGAAGCGLSEPAQQQGRALALRIQAHSCRGDPDRGRRGSSGCTSPSGAGSVRTFHVPGSKNPSSQCCVMRIRIKIFKLDPNPPQSADVKPKCMEYEPIKALFQGCEPFFEAWIRIRINVMQIHNTASNNYKRMFSRFFRKKPLQPKVEFKVQKKNFLIKKEYLIET
jgi:hypothetical protein